MCKNTFRLSIVLWTTIASLAPSADAAGSAITLSDNTFAPADWNTLRVYDSKPGAGSTYSGFQDTSSGLPQPSLGGTLVSGTNYSGYETIALVQQYMPSVANPIHATSPDVIDSVSMAFDLDLFPNPVYPPAQMLLQAVVSQNGVYYFGPTPFTSDLVEVAQGWVHVAISNLQSSNFAEMNPTTGLVTGSHPDFNSPFSVGIGVSRTTQIPLLPGEWRIDNWTMQANLVPEPSALFLGAVGGIACLLYARRLTARRAC